MQVDGCSIACRFLISDSPGGRDRKSNRNPFQLSTNQGLLRLRLSIAAAAPVLSLTAVSGGPSCRLPLSPLRLPIRLRGIALICLERVVTAYPFLIGVALPADETAIVDLFRCNTPRL